MCALRASLYRGLNPTAATARFRYGVRGLTDRSRRPYGQANQLPLQIEKLIVRLKREQIL